MNNQDELFDIGPVEEVGTQILEPNLPSNLDFQDNKQPLELQPRGNKAQTINKLVEPIENDQISIKEFSIKGHPQFSLPPKYPIGSIAPPDISTFLVHDLSEDQRSQGIWGIWQSLAGYVKREMVIDEGYISVFSREKEGLRSVGHWRLIDLFKVFVDPEESQLRLVITIEGSSQLLTRDFTSGQLSNIVARLREKSNALGLSLVG